MVCNKYEIITPIDQSIKPLGENQPQEVRALCTRLTGGGTCDWSGDEPCSRQNMTVLVNGILVQLNVFRKQDYLRQQ